MGYEFRVQRIVEFADTDMAGILHFANYFRYMEAAEHAFFRSLGLKVHAHSDTGVWGWARGHAECTFRRPLRYEDRVELHVVVREKRTKSIAYDIVFRKVGPEGCEPLEVARGSMTVVCVRRTPNGDRLEAVPMPVEVADRIQAAPRELLERGGC